MTDMTDNSNPSVRLSKSTAGLHPNQSSVALELGLDLAKLSSAEAVVDAIASTLGKAAQEESARWFAISVLKHLRKAKWADPTGSGLDEARQTSLAKDCLAIDGFSTSLHTVTKDARSKFRIIGFASSKKIERGVLATGTKAYKIAATVIVKAGMIEAGTTQTRLVQPLAEQASNKAEPKKQLKTIPAEPKAVEKTVVGRRAKHRGYVEAETMSVADIAEVASAKNQTVAMSKEEFADLDAALSKNDAEIIQQNWGDQPNEDRWSRILGILAGVGFFVFVVLLFL